jgi:hypothetical protein
MGRIELAPACIYSSPCQGGFSPLLFRGGEEPRSGGGVGFVRQTQHQPDKPHPNPVEGRGAFGVSPRHKVRITKAPPPPCFAWSRCCSATPSAPPCRGGITPLPHASHGPAVAPQRLRLPRAGEELPPSPHASHGPPPRAGEELPPSSLGEGRSRAAAEGWGLSVKRSTSPTAPPQPRGGEGCV